MKNSATEKEQFEIEFENSNGSSNDLNVESKNFHFEALRGILALTVLISHVSLIRLYFGRSKDFLNPVIFHLGKVAVTGFFVLSGYLITNSILKRIQNKNWNLTNFYKGRIFRIWPLYFFIIIFAVWIFPNIDLLHFPLPNYVNDVRMNFYDKWYFVFFLPQVPFMHNAVLPFAEPTWSIGVEELFYIAIPLVILITKNKFKTSLIVFLLLFLVIKYAAIYYYQLPSPRYLAKIVRVYSYDSVSLGCLIAVLQFNKSKIISSAKILHVILAVAAIFILFKFLTLKSYDYFPFAICFAVIVAYFVNRKDNFRSPKWLVYLGTISYSLYLTHEIAIVFLVNMNIDNRSMVLMYLLSICLAIMLASIVYHTIEKPFMNYGKAKLISLSKNN